MNRTVVFVTLLFILLTGPGAVISAMFSYILSLPYGLLLIVFVDSIAFSYHAYGLIILYKTNKKFANHLRSVAGYKQNVSVVAGPVSARTGTSKSNG